MNTFKITFFFLTLTFIGCSYNNEIDRLETTGILGNWEINFRNFNGIEPLVTVCCEYIEFTLDENKEDRSGIYFYSSEEFNKTGVFKIDDSNQILIMKDDNGEDVYEYNLSESQEEFILLYSDQVDNLVRENWVKID